MATSALTSGSPSPQAGPTTGAISANGGSSGSADGSRANGSSVDCVGDSGDLVGSIARPYTEAAIARSLQQQIVACDDPGGAVSVTCGSPQTYTADGYGQNLGNYYVYPCEVQVQGQNQAILSGNYSIILIPGNGKWANGDE